MIENAVTTHESGKQELRTRRVRPQVHVAHAQTLAAAARPTLHRNEFSSDIGSFCSQTEHCFTFSLDNVEKIKELSDISKQNNNAPLSGHDSIHYN